VMADCHICDGTGEMEISVPCSPSEATGGMSELTGQQPCEACGGSGREPADPPRPFTPEQVGIGYFTTLLSAYITDPTALHAASVEMRDWVARLLRQPPADWQPIATAPKMQTILLFAVTDIAPDGTVRNWRKETGCWMTGYDTDSCRKQNLTPWRWGSDQLKTYQVQPTHWMPLPPSPTEALARPASESASSASNPTTPALPAAPERITPKDKE
jgi:hypothetical protein